KPKAAAQPPSQRAAAHNRQAPPPLAPTGGFSPPRHVPSARAKQEDKSDLPEPLREFPRDAISPEALEAARAGRSPFGPDPLMERRSGMDRRSGSDRRNATELVFRNSRYGGNRRSTRERRADVPPTRPNDLPVEDAIG